MKKIKFIKKKISGRDSSGKVVVRHQGGEEKRFFRVIDFKREKKGTAGRVVSIEYDPNRTADIALVIYADGEKSYILSPEGLKLGDKIISSDTAPMSRGNAMPIGRIPIGTIVHNVELTPGRGGQLARGAGTGATIAAHEDGLVHIKLPSGEVRKISAQSFATIGNIGNVDWKNTFFGKAGRKRHMGIRPTVRGVAQNPRSHPHGGGEGRSGVGLKSPKTYTGKKAVGKTRKQKKYSDKYILSGRRVKK
ncbi:MAG: 50S ribosomal protein L2 [Microgenomates group bacterium GW2011_GWC1_38_14]|nr:MAG: 50S ribosomal protein L2 [Candidatus Levybacteria bacterium GW2011_GWA2_36_13]KKQ00792.1 MAG: 50S ribosomal protein L2 [Candidatus Levybacteria bacterium GW2011_GWB1_36_18]KKQ58297.1 MAG: 50S ribosomal protein L2 [Microgenomates group bacterium GW2011_GWC1_38_14]KKR15890.1 MAG: 50S ribosomal protein L2 [Candidatus Levybacteria bacterium GW2011_GWA1_39_32]OGH43832.1 MAG: 50S ribosomal protein L2 [Candidatus Levybacteria bacterium RIFCSPLOWO2_02_FULL_37_11]